MATLYSKADLRNRALRLLTVIDHSEEPLGDMTTYADGIMQQFIEGLDDENLLIFDPSTSVSTQVIPARVLSPMTDLLAWELAPSYGKPRSGPGETAEQRYTKLLNALRRHCLQGSDPIPVQADYF